MMGPVELVEVGIQSRIPVANEGHHWQKFHLQNWMATDTDANTQFHAMLKQFFRHSIQAIISIELTKLFCFGDSTS